MALSTGERPRFNSFRGLEQFAVRGDTNGVGYCLAGAKPYALEFSNTADVICLLLGDINSSTKFEDDLEKPLLFLGESPPFIRASAMSEFVRTTCATALSLSATRTSFRVFWMIATLTGTGAKEAVTTSVTTPSNFLPATCGSVCADPKA